MKTKVDTFISLIHHLGWRWLLFRLAYACALKIGYFVWKTPEKDWAAVGIPAGSEGQTPRPTELNSIDEETKEQITAAAERVLKGQFRFYFNRWVEVGMCPDWHKNFITGERAPRNRHWSKMGDFDYGDIKNIWEPSRFGWAYLLAQAYSISLEERYAESFWRFFEQWTEANPPNCGVNWKCGQEVALRMMAIMYSRGVYTAAAATTTARIHLYRTFVFVSGQRIAANIHYALSQSNNHGISECVGLIAAGLALPNAPQAQRWVRIGVKHLRKQVKELVYVDGGFSQFSINYHRVVLDQFTWLMRLLQTNDRPIPDWLRDAAYRAAEWLHALADPITGKAPCWGGNDGAWVLPLGGNDYLDYRPSVQACLLACSGQIAYTDSCVSDLARMIGVDDATIQTAKILEQESGLRVFRDSGLGVIRSGRSLGVLRGIEAFKHRPSHSDLLHFSLMYQGQSLIVDPGTYSYNPAVDLARSDAHRLGEASYHNGPLLDGGNEPMQKVGRFLYLPWPRGSLRELPSCDLSIEAEYAACGLGGTVFKRKVSCSAEDCWVIEDRVQEQGGQASLKWHWLFPACEYVLDQESAELVLYLRGDKWVFSWENGLSVVPDSGSHGFYGRMCAYYHAYEDGLSLLLTSSGNIMHGTFQMQKR